MNFKSAAAVEEVVYEMLLYEFPRAEDRSKINRLFNGAPPLSPREAEENQIATNVNDLSSTKIDHDARRQFDQAFVVPDPLFTVGLDFGPVHKKQSWSQVITKESNRIVTNSVDYLDLRQGIFASVVLHGIGPAMWEDRYSWKQTELGIEDVLVPGRTLRSLKNVPFTAIYRQFTGMELWKLTHGPRVDPGWNMTMVDQALKWVDEQTQTLMGTEWANNQWFPEKWEERFKESSGVFAGDAVPTIDCWFFYYWDDDKKSSGWRRKVILDWWGQPGVGAFTAGKKPERDSKRYGITKGDFLYDSKQRVYAPDLSQIIHFQFGDASAVAPFRYHSVRSLGFLLYAVCHLQNRLKCRFTDSVFESLMQYFRVANANDMERVSKVDLIDKGVLPEGAQFVRPEERWKIDAQLVTEAMQLNRQTMADVSSSFTQDLDLQNEEARGRETATRTMAKVNSTAALVGSMLNRAYAYEKFRYREMMRRFCIPNSKDPEVVKFRTKVLKQDVPEEALDVDKMDIQPNRVVGGGNKMMQVAIADKLMAVRQFHGPEAQHEILRFYDSVVTDDYAFANDLNPEQPHISDSVHDTELVFGSLLQGNPVTPRPGLNAIEVVETLLKLMQNKVQQIQQMGGVGTPQDVMGLQLAAQYASAFIQQLAQDKQEKQRVSQYEKALTAIMNFVKAFAQRQQEMAKKAAEQNGGASAEDQQKLKFEAEKAQLKLKTQSLSHAQRLAQRQLQFEAEEKRAGREHAVKLQQDSQEHAQGLHHELRQHHAELLKKGTEAKANAEAARMRSLESE